MKQIVTTLTTLLLSLLLPIQVMGEGYVLDATVTSVRCHQSYSACAIIFDKPIVGRDSCHTIDINRMQLRVDDDLGKAMLSLAITAQTAQRKVNIYSSGSCTIVNGLSDLADIEVKNY